MNDVEFLEIHGEDYFAFGQELAALFSNSLNHEQLWQIEFFEIALGYHPVAIVTHLASQHYSNDFS